MTGISRDTGTLTFLHCPFIIKRKQEKECLENTVASSEKRLSTHHVLIFSLIHHHAAVSVVSLRWGSAKAVA